jgi:hypothetical protein
MAERRRSNAKSSGGAASSERFVVLNERRTPSRVGPRVGVIERYLTRGGKPLSLTEEQAGWFEQYGPAEPAPPGLDTVDLPTS